jgi:pentatricopeptide repeat protein
VVSKDSDSNSSAVHKVIAEGVLNMLTTYHQAIKSPSSSRELIRQYVSDAEQLVNAALQNDYVMMKHDSTRSHDLRTNIENTLMFFYACVGELDAAEALFNKEVQPTFVRYMALIKAYGENDLADRATAILLRMLDDDKVKIYNSFVFATLTDAWAKSSDPNALEEAFKVFTLLEHHPRCCAIQLRPCSGLFNNILNCIANQTSATTTTVHTTIPSLFWGGAQYQSDNLASSSDSSSPDNIPMTVTSTTHLQDESTSTSGSDSTGSSGSTIRGTFDTCRLAIAVLDEMERRSQKYGEAKPTSVTYTLVIKTCFRANNLELADQMMKRMESSDTPPNLRTYTDIIIHFGSLRTAFGAEQAETIFHYLKKWRSSNHL